MCVCVGLCACVYMYVSVSACVREREKAIEHDGEGEVGQEPLEASFNSPFLAFCCNHLCGGKKRRKSHFS